MWDDRSLSRHYAEMMDLLLLSAPCQIYFEAVIESMNCKSFFVIEEIKEEGQIIPNNTPASKIIENYRILSHDPLFFR